MSKKDDSAAYGMELRDYFAAAALQGMLSHSQDYARCTDIARVCYQLADAMLKEREEQ
jgi:hypothetical protein